MLIYLYPTYTQAFYVQALLNLVAFLERAQSVLSVILLNFIISIVYHLQWSRYEEINDCIVDRAHR